MPTFKRAPLEAGDKIDNGHVAREHTEGHTSEFTVQDGNHLGDGLGRTSRRQNNVGSGTTPAAPVLYGGPSTVFWMAVMACKVVIKPSTMPGLPWMTLARGGGSLACSRCWRRRDVDVQSVLVFVNTQYEHGCRGGRDDYLLRATYEAFSLVLKTPCVSDVYEHIADEL